MLFESRMDVRVCINSRQSTLSVRSAFLFWKSLMLDNLYRQYIKALFDGRLRTGRRLRRASQSRAAVVERLEFRRLLAGTPVPPLSQTAFTAVGPASITGDGFTGGNVSGRITGIAADPTNASIIYIAAAGGGVWKTSDGGGRWNPLTDFQATLAMGAIALAPSNPSVLYAGTGEANNSGDSQPGLGVFVSKDAGVTWTLTGATPFDHEVISKIAVDPTDPAKAWVAASYWGGGTPGIYKTTDYGANWKLVYSASNSFGYSDVIVDTKSTAGSRTLFAAVGSAGGNANNGVYVSTDDGASWNLSGNFAKGSSNGRISVAIAPSDSKTLYASVADPGTGGLKELDKSIDGGATWSKLDSTPNYMGGQGWYDQILAVSPTDAKIVFAGGQYAYGGTSPNGLIETTDGGVTWTEIGIKGANGIGVHPDHHAVAFTADGKLLDGNDGGIFRLEDANPNSFVWSDLNSNLNITQFTGIALDPTNPTIAYGGSQDNGTEKLTGSMEWQLVRGGDGGFVRVDPAHPNTVYHTFYYSPGFFERSDDGGLTWNGAGNGINDADPALPDEEDPAAFYPPYVVDTVNTSRLVLGTNRVYETVDKGNTWTPISSPGTGGWTTSAIITSIATVGNTIYAAAGGHIYVTTNDGGSWTETTPESSTSFSYDDITINPTTPTTAYAVTFGHVVVTTNGGTAWTDISGSLPQIGIHAVRVDTRNNAIYVGTDFGVDVSFKNGIDWKEAASGLPHVQVVGLDLNPTTSILGVATHGRGMWELSVAIGNPSLSNIEQSTLSYNEKAKTVVTQTLTVTETGGLYINNATVQITSNYQSGQDQLLFSDTSQITGTWDSATGTLILQGLATPDLYQQALRSVMYYDRSDNPSPLTRVVSFQVGAATQSAILSRNIVIIPVNDPPVITLDSGTLDYIRGSVTQVSPSLTVTDPDNDTLVSAVVRITGNYQNGEDFLIFPDTAKITGAWDAATGTLSLTGVDTVSNYRTALRSIAFYDRWLLPNTSLRTVSFSVSDGSLSSNTASRNINVIRLNNPPVLSAIETTPSSYLQNSSAVIVTQTIAVTDTEDNTLVSATIKVSSGYQIGADVLSFVNTAKITGAWNATTGTLTLTGVDTLSNYRTALRTVKFSSVNGSVGNSARTIAFQVSDGKDLSNIASRNINVTGVPNLSGIETNLLSYTVQNQAAVITNTLQVAVFDGGKITKATVHIVNVQSGDVLASSTIAGITSTWDPTTGTLTLAGASSAANYQALLRTVNYRNPSAFPSSLRRQISFQIFEGSIASNTVFRNINFTSSNDQPELNGIESTPLVYVPNSGAKVLSSSINAFDPDHLNLVSAIIQITGNYRMGQDVLGFVDTPTIKGIWTPATGKLVLTGIDTVANYQAALRSVTYTNVANFPSPVTRTVSFRISNGAVANAYNSNTLTRDITIKQ
jgi:hypothetical protein